MYLIGIRNGTNPAGNDGTMRFLGDIIDLPRMAKSWAKLYNHDEVWMIQRYTQEACEMSIGEFVSYVRRTGTILYKRNDSDVA